MELLPPRVSQETIGVARLPRCTGRRFTAQTPISVNQTVSVFRLAFSNHHTEIR